MQKTVHHTAMNTVHHTAMNTVLKMITTMMTVGMMIIIMMIHIISVTVMFSMMKQWVKIRFYGL